MAFDENAPLANRLIEGDDLRSRVQAAGRIEELRYQLEEMVKYADWQVREGADHHPTLPSALERARAVLKRKI